MNTINIAQKRRWVYGVFIVTCVLAVPASPVQSAGTSPPNTVTKPHGNIHNKSLNTLKSAHLYLHPETVYGMPNGWKGGDPKKLDNMSIEPLDPQYRQTPKSNESGGGLNNNGLGGGLGNHNFGGNVFGK